MAKLSSKAARYRRHLRVRAKVHGTDSKPRLSVFRSLNHIYAQIIDDASGRTLASASSLESEVKDISDSKKKTEEAGIVGSVFARRALAAGIKKVVFDRGGYKYHGRVKALAEAARKEGLQF